MPHVPEIDAGSDFSAQFEVVLVEKNDRNRLAQRLFCMKDPPDNVLPSPVIRMRFSRIDNLEIAGVLGDLAKAIQVGKNKVSAFVSRGAPREPDGKDIVLKPESRLFAHNFEEFVFCYKVRGPNVFRGKPQGTSQTVVVFTPVGNEAVEKVLKSKRSPRPGVNAVSNGFDRHFREHLPRSFAVLPGHAVNISAQIQSQVSHVDAGAQARRFLQIRIILLGAQDALDEVSRRGVLEVEKLDLLGEDASEVFDGEPVMPCRDRGVGGEHAHASNFFYVLTVNTSSSRFGGLGSEQFQREERGVAFVHVISRQVCIAQSA